MKVRWLILVVSFCCSAQALAQPKSIGFETLDSLQKQEPRPVIVFLHAEWCKYCEAMKQTTFLNEEVIELLNTNFYFVSFDGETKEDVRFLGNTFRFKPSGNGIGVHELAHQLGSNNGTLTYPMMVFMNEQFEILYQHAGFVNAKDLGKILEDLVEFEGAGGNE